MKILARFNRAAICAALALVTGASMVAPARAASPTEQLHALFTDHFEWRKRESPEYAMHKGDYTYADRITDNSQSAHERRCAAEREFLERVRSIPTAGLSEADLLNREIFERQLRESIDGERFHPHLAPIGGRFGPQQDVPQMHERVRFNSALDYENYLKRLEATPRSLHNTMELLKAGIAEGRTPPRVCMAGVEEQFHALLQPLGLQSLSEPFAKFPASVTAEQRTALRKRFDEQTLPQLRAALAELAAFVSNEYLPKCRESIAAIDWPDGAAMYEHQLRVMTTTDMTAREIHELGLREVARIRAEMLAVIRRSDFMQSRPDASTLDDATLFREFVAYLRSNPRFYYTTEDDLLRGYRDISKRIDAELPRLFNTLPRLSYGVRKIPDFMAPAQTTAYYQPGNLKNAESGTFYANTYRLNQRPRYEMIPLTLHEAVPGHHLQIALAEEVDGLPEFRKDAWFTGFGEGWALYAERLGIEMGLFADPYDDFGRLTYEMWRAARLVVDPGMHALGWSRAKAVQFMLDNSALTETNVNAEVDRYVAWPGQATAYKVGELKIRDLRARAEKTLGERFNVREFHDVVLLNGTLPLTVLESRVDRWIASVSRTGALPAASAPATGSSQ